MLTLPALYTLKETGSRFIIRLNVRLLAGAAYAKWMLRVLSSYVNAG